MSKFVAKHISLIQKNFFQGFGQVSSQVIDHVYKAWPLNLIDSRETCQQQQSDLKDFDFYSQSKIEQSIGPSMWPRFWSKSRVTIVHSSFVEPFDQASARCQELFHRVYRSVPRSTKWPQGSGVSLAIKNTDLVFRYTQYELWQTL